MNAIYDKQEGESALAFAAFCVYRDMGASRSLAGAYRLKTGKKQAKYAGGQFTDWYERFDWKKRAESFDADEDKRRRSEQAETHKRELEAYRQRVIEGARKRADAATEFLKKGLEALETVDVKKISPNALPSYLESAMRVYEKASQLEGIALGVLEGSEQ